MARSDFIYRQGTSPVTRSLLSIKNRVFSFNENRGTGFIQIGAMSSFAPSFSRPVNAVRGIGYGDQIAELVPNVEEPVTISVARTAMYLENIMQVFGYKAGTGGLVRSLKHHKWPFDVKQEIVLSDIANQEVTGGIVPSTDPCHDAIITIFEACWLHTYRATYSTDTTLVSEDCDFSVSDVVDGVSLYTECIETGNAFKSGRFRGQFIGGRIPVVTLNPVGV
jgi:hypothetical protein